MLDALRRWWSGGQRPTGPVLVQPGNDRLGADTLPTVPGDTRGGPVPDAAVALVAKWEGFRSRPYLCPAGVPTIGYGATYYMDGKRVTLGDAPLQEPDARLLLRSHLARFAGQVDAAVKVPINAGERGALVSLAYNIGIGAFRGSTLLAMLNAGNRDGAAGQFARWNRAGGKVLTGLTARRAEEAAMFRGVAL